MPRVPPEATTSSVPHHFPSSTDPSSSQLQHSNSIPSSSNKENAFPADLQTPPWPTASSAAATSPSSERVPDSQPQSFTPPTNETLPTPLISLLDSIKTALKSLFASKPPHTIQRLAELILYPNVHYRTLPAYLRALDRVVSVTSSAEIFPLQVQASANQPNGVTNGGGGSFLFDQAPGSDESLGGALLTPIPWLSNDASFEDGTGETGMEGKAFSPLRLVVRVKSNHYTAGAESVSITIHQDLHQEPQQLPEGEAEQQPQPQLQEEFEITTTTTTQEVTLPTQSATTPAIEENTTMGGSESPPPADTEELPHARGPPVVGVEDMGLQDGKGVEMPLSNGEGGEAAAAASKNDRNTDQPTTSEKNNDEGQNKEPASLPEEGGKKDGDGDTPVLDSKDENGEGAAESAAAESSTEKPQ